MDSVQIGQIVFYAVCALAGLAGLWLLTRWFVNIGGQQIGIKERRYFGNRLPAGRAFATNGEVGIQADYLSPGLKFVAWPFVSLIERANFVVIGEDELGLVTATDGDSMPSNRIFAEDKAGEHHDNFQDPVAFLNNGGVRGLQLRFLTNGQWKIHSKLFTVTRIKKTFIPQGKIGVVTARDGAPLDNGKLLGKHVEGHDNFQRPEVFLRNGGQKGPQVDILRPGTYNIHTEMFAVEIRDAINIGENQIGVVEAKSGEALPKGDVVAKTPELRTHQNYQDGQAFLDNGGIRGPQELVLAPGEYYVNPYLFSVTQRPQTVIKQGEVGVLISNVGQDPSGLTEEHDGGLSNGSGSTPKPNGNAKDPEESRLDKGTRQRHVVPEGYRGIQQEVLSPGKYNINPLAYTVITIPTNMRSVEWSAGQQAGTFDPFVVVSHDGFEMKVEVRAQYRILPENAPYVVSKLGSVAELESNVIHPQIDGIFRAQVSKSPAIAYQQNRAEEQRQAETAVRDDLRQYRVEVVSVMITNIHLPEALMKTTQEKNLAETRQGMYDAQREAEKRRIEFEKTKAQADQQGAIMKAEVGIEIADKEAQARVKKAAGDAAYTKETGLAAAEVTEAQGKAQGAAFREQQLALGQAGLALREIMQVAGANKLALVPQIVAGGGGNGNGGSGDLTGVLLGLLVRQLVEQKPADGQTTDAAATDVTATTEVAPSTAAPTVPAGDKAKK